MGHPYNVSGLIQFTVHDFSYVGNLLPRPDCDWMMLETLGAFGGNTWFNRNAVWSAVKAFGGGVYPKTNDELSKYRDYVFLTDLGATGGHCVDLRLTGVGQRKSARPEIILD